MGSDRERYESPGTLEDLGVAAPLGGGRRHQVFRAWDRRTGSAVAVKVMRAGRAREGPARAAFAREVRISSRIDHPGFARLIRWGEGERPYLVLELIEAPTLAAHLVRRGAIRVPEACLLGSRLLSAIDHLHARRIAHLDVKPANITIGDRPRLLDLGCARDVPVLIGRPVGTAAYMSPEQCLGRIVTTASDLFGLGATLYESLTGLRAFSAGDPSSEEPPARFPQLVEDVQPLRQLIPAVPPRLAALVHACLALDPRDRPDTSAAAAELYGVLVDLGLGALARAGASARPWLS